MVKEITAFMADDLTMYPTYDMAAHRNAYLVLLDLFDGNVGITNTVLVNAKKVNEVLGHMLTIPSD